MGYAKIFPLNFKITHGGKYCEKETWIPLDQLTHSVQSEVSPSLLCPFLDVFAWLLSWTFHPQAESEYFKNKLMF